MKDVSIKLDLDLGHFWLMSYTDPSWDLNTPVELEYGIWGQLTEYGLRRTSSTIIWLGCGLFKSRADKYKERLNEYFLSGSPHDYEKLCKDIPTPTIRTDWYE